MKIIKSTAFIDKDILTKFRDLAGKSGASVLLEIAGTEFEVESAVKEPFGKGKVLFQFAISQELFLKISQKSHKLDVSRSEIIQELMKKKLAAETTAESELPKPKEKIRTKL